MGWGWKKDQIEELAEELDIDGGDSMSQLDRMRAIAKQVGMESFNGLSNSDTDELERRLKERRNQRKFNNNSTNNQNNRPIRRNNHNNHRGNIFRKSKDSAGPAKSQSKYQSSSSGFGNSPIKGEFKIKIPLKAKITILLILVPFILIALAIFVLLGSDFESGGSGVGSFAYGKTCTKVKVENTGCDEDGNNCSLIYDGEVPLEDYIAGIVAAEVGNANNLEFYKLAAIVTRTYIFGNISDNCKVEGNVSFKNYIDVEDSAYSSLIKKAVEETKQVVIIKNDDLIHAHYSQACVVNKDNEKYYIRYGSRMYDDPQMQEISSQWDQNNSAFTGTLSSLYSQTDINNTNLEKKDCPNNNNDYGLSQIGAYYLITEQNYSYQSVLEYYYGLGVESVTNEMRLSGAEGFINPTTSVNCTSPFGTRIHPVSKKEEYHSGLDIGVTGAIYAASDGIVNYVKNDVSAINNCSFGYGNYIVVNHANGVSTLYAHIKYGSIPDSIYIGAEVKQGEQIGEVGSTGCSTGAHLHYEVKENNVNVDPTNYMDLTGATGTCKR